VNDLRILIIAEDPLARAGLAMLLSDQPGCTVVGQLAGEAAQPSSLDTFQPDVLLWDLGWDPTLALEMLAGLSDAGLPLVALLTDETYAIEAWTAGAHGLLPRETDGANLRAALIAAAARGVDSPGTGSATTPGGRAAQQVHSLPPEYQRAHCQVSRKRNYDQAGRSKPHRRCDACYPRRADSPLIPSHKDARLSRA
jgi:DNA-binding NarL/FixJ family response regulator